MSHAPAVLSVGLHLLDHLSLDDLLTGFLHLPVDLSFNLINWRSWSGRPDVGQDGLGFVQLVNADLLLGCEHWLLHLLFQHSDFGVAELLDSFAKSFFVACSDSCFNLCVGKLFLISE